MVLCVLLFVRSIVGVLVNLLPHPNHIICLMFPLVRRISVGGFTFLPLVQGFLFLYVCLKNAFLGLSPCLDITLLIKCNFLKALS